MTNQQLNVLNAILSGHADIVQHGGYLKAYDVLDEGNDRHDVKFSDADSALLTAAVQRAINTIVEEFDELVAKY